MLVIVPEHGLIENSAMKIRMNYAPQWRYARVPGGHHCHLDDPAPSAEHIAAFLDEDDDQLPMDAAVAPPMPRL